MSHKISYRYGFAHFLDSPYFHQSENESLRNSIRFTEAFAHLCDEKSHLKSFLRRSASKHDNLPKRNSIIPSFDDADCKNQHL